jgi:hypothetical protein
MADKMESEGFKNIVHLNDLGTHFLRVQGKGVTHTFYLIPF